MFCTYFIDPDSDTLLDMSLPLVYRQHAAGKKQRLTRCNILHAQEAMLATTSVSCYTHYLVKCIILSIQPTEAFFFKCLQFQGCNIQLN